MRYSVASPSTPSLTCDCVALFAHRTGCLQPYPPTDPYVDLIVCGETPWDTSAPTTREALGISANKRRVFYVEPPRLSTYHAGEFDATCRGGGLFVVTPYLPLTTADAPVLPLLHRVIESILRSFQIQTYELFDPHAADPTHTPITRPAPETDANKPYEAPYARTQSISAPTLYHPSLRPGRDLSPTDRHANTQ